MSELSQGRNINKAERLFTILNLLRERSTITAKELAAYCQTTVRTIYRDMNLLESVGVHFISEGKLGYRLVQGPSLPNRMLSKEEWLALLVYPLITSDITSTSHPVHHAYRSGIEKLKALTRKSSTAQLIALSEELGERIHYNKCPNDKNSNRVMPVLLQSIAENRVLEINYYAIYKDEVMTRSIHPYYILPREGTYT